MLVEGERKLVYLLLSVQSTKDSYPRSRPLSFRQSSPPPTLGFRILARMQVAGLDEPKLDGAPLPPSHQVLVLPVHADLMISDVMIFGAFNNCHQ